MEAIAVAKAATSLSQALQVSGGWGLAALLMVVVWRREVFYQKTLSTKDSLIKERDERIFKLLDKQNEVFSLLKVFAGRK